MRTIKHIVLHCTATSRLTTVNSILRYWKEELKWKSPGYHYIIKADGEEVNLLPISMVSNGVAGHNSNSIHISYIGGIDQNGKPTDTRTPPQIATQIRLLKKFMAMFPEAEVLGHRDFPGVTKACPSFDVRTWLKSVKLK